ncbi:AI-2E family transporter [Bacillus sp. B1-b2]|uniref:AI-2E family transporter n=1 Tax=Bacillus sp. B1-b2 TaxID=2653201 RepID=UPI0012621480|nr:AI-2E family transporter [Bacillus sp. B1-b2]KAB7668831.1 AI-2E family transporter [Bacillus sp. B1-b2]
METVNKILTNKSIKRFLIFVLILSGIYLLRSMVNLMLFTFILSFLMDRMERLISKVIHVKRNLIVSILYLITIGILSYSSIKYLPMLVEEISTLVRQLYEFYTRPHDNVVLNYIVSVIQERNIYSYVEQGLGFVVKYFSSISSLSIQFLLAIILSFFFLLEKPRLIKYKDKFKKSKIAPIYNEIEFFGKKFVLTFGKVLEAQVIIALVNCILTTIGLWILDFPQLLGLSLMVFVFGLIPVAGVIISLIPLLTIGYTIGGYPYIIILIIFICVIHAIEAYILNPKLMSSKTDLPVFFTFIVLIFSEHFFGVWGLIIGIPVFVFLLDILQVQSMEPDHELAKKDNG